MLKYFKFFRIVLIALWIAGSISSCKTNVQDNTVKTEVPVVESEITNTVAPVVVENINNNNTATSEDKKIELPTTNEKKETAKIETVQTENKKITFIELGSVNCIPCRMMKPVMERIEKEYAGKVDVVFYDVLTREGQPYGQKYRIRVIPTQVFLDANGNEFFRNEGFFPFEKCAEIFMKMGIE